MGGIPSSVVLNTDTTTLYYSQQNVTHCHNGADFEEQMAPGVNFIKLK